MRHFIRCATLGAALLNLALAGCDGATGQAAAPDDHSSPGGHAAHGAHGPGAEDELDPISVTIFTPKTELFMEYPHLVKGVEADFLAYFTVLETGEPVRIGSLTFELTPTDGAPVTQVWDAPRRDGLFVPERVFDAPGRYRLRLIVDSPQVQDTIDVGELIVHANEAEAEQAAEDTHRHDPPDLVTFLLEQQWKIRVRLASAAHRTLVQRLMTPGRIVAPQGAAAAVSPPISGRLLPPPDGALPRIGDVVEAGQILAVIEPPLPATERVQLDANRAQVQALETELALRELDLDTKTLEVERSIIQAEARLEFARGAMDRATQLRDKGVGTGQHYDEARQSLRLAEAEHTGAAAMKDAYREAKSRLAQLRTRALPPDDTLENRTSFGLPLRAPIAGEIVQANHIQGEHVEAGEHEVFRIVNTTRVWIEASISEFDLARFSVKPGALLTLPAYPDKRFDVLGAGQGRLVNIARLVDPDSRTVGVVYEMPNPEGLFRIGMFADMHLETATSHDAVAIPESAIVLDNGRPTTYVLIDGEHFQKRELELGIRDGGYLEVKSGVSASERVVTEGGYAIKLSSLSPAAFGHGHGH